MTSHFWLKNKGLLFTDLKGLYISEMLEESNGGGEVQLRPLHWRTIVIPLLSKSTPFAISATLKPFILFSITLTSHHECKTLPCLLSTSHHFLMWLSSSGNFSAIRRHPRASVLQYLSWCRQESETSRDLDWNDCWTYCYDLGTRGWCYVLELSG
jgi:hypothetical protein